MLNEFTLYVSQENEDLKVWRRWLYQKTTKIIEPHENYILFTRSISQLLLVNQIKAKVFFVQSYAINKYISLFFPRRWKDSFSYDKCAFLSVDFIQFYLQFVRLCVFFFCVRVLRRKKRDRMREKKMVYTKYFNANATFHALVHFTHYTFTYDLSISILLWMGNKIPKKCALEWVWVKMYVCLCAKQKFQHPNEIARKKKKIK